MMTSQQATRDIILYKVDVVRGNVEQAVHLLAEAVLRPKFSDVVATEVPRCHTCGVCLTLIFIITGI